MAHAPGVGYSGTKPGSSGFKATPSGATSASAPAPAAAPAPAPAAAATPPTFSMPDLSGISLPGNSSAQKALVVLGILIAGFFLYSRATGKTLSIPLVGPSAAIPAPANPNTVAAAGPSTSMLQRIAAANPAKAA